MHLLYITGRIKNRAKSVIPIICHKDIAILIQKVNVASGHGYITSRCAIYHPLTIHETWLMKETYNEDKVIAIPGRGDSDETKRIPKNTRR